MPCRTVEHEYTPNQPVDGMPYEQVWIQECDISATNQEVIASLFPQAYSPGVEQLYVYPQVITLKVEWLGSAGESQEPAGAATNGTGDITIIEGRWDVLLNGQPFEMEIGGAPGDMTGSLTFGGVSVEPLEAVSFDPSTSTLRFARPIGGGQYQLYTGTLEGGRLSGFFETGPLDAGFEQGSLRYAWSGSRPENSANDFSVAVLSGSDAVVPDGSAPPNQTTATGQPQGPVEALVLNTLGAVRNGPSKPSRFRIDTPVMVKSIMTYHWNDGQGTTPGSIGLQDENGRTVGTWQAYGTAGQGGVLNAYWHVEPGIVLQPGIYTIVDSEPTTWSTNAEVGERGVFEITFQR